MSLRIIFMGTPDFAVPTLQAMAEQGHNILAVYTRAPRPAGRGLEIKPSPVEQEARRLGRDVRTPKTLKTAEEQTIFAAYQPDVAIVVAYGLILPPAILHAPRLGCFNLHASLLPRWRGAAPIQRAIMAGDKKTGVMVMKMDEGLDTGPIALSEETDIPSEMTAGELQDKLAKMGAGLMTKALDRLENSSLTLTPQQEEGATYAAKIEKHESRMNWSWPAARLQDHIRGLSPFPGAWCEINKERIKIFKSTLAQGQGLPGVVLDSKLTVACGQGAIQLLEVQRAGSRPMSGEELLRGMRIATGTLLIRRPLAPTSDAACSQ